MLSDYPSIFFLAIWARPSELPEGRDGIVAGSRALWLPSSILSPRYLPNSINDSCLECLSLLVRLNNVTDQGLPRYWKKWLPKEDSDAQWCRNGLNVGVQLQIRPVLISRTLNDINQKPVEESESSDLHIKVSPASHDLSTPLRSWIA